MKKLFFIFFFPSLFFLASAHGQPCPQITCTDVSQCGYHQYTLHLCWNASGNVAKRIRVSLPGGDLNECFSATHDGCKDIVFYSDEYPSKIKAESFIGQGCNGAPCDILVLPVVLSSFTATRDGSTVVVKWETASEQNSKGFSLERSDKDTSWREAASIPSKAPDGFSAISIEYQYADFNTEGGMTRYRLRQQDRDGRSTVSSILAVRGSEQIGIKVYPNPTTGSATVVFGDNARHDAALFDASGKQLLVWHQAIGSIPISIGHAGVFIFKILSEGQVQQIERIVVTK